MQEIAIILSSLAGVATAAAARKMPRNKTQLLSLGASSHIKSQINSLKIEKTFLQKLFLDYTKQILISQKFNVINCC